VPNIAFFNNKGGVGKTTLVYHLAAMFSDLGVRVLAVDLDPQANLSAMCLPEESFLNLWPDGAHPDTLFGAVAPIMEGTGDIAVATIQEIDPAFGLLAGDLSLSSFEGDLAQAWPNVLDRRINAVRQTTAFARIIDAAAREWAADLVLIDVGPNLGALNRAALLSATHVITPLAPDLFSLQGLRNLGPALSAWREEWRERYDRNLDRGVSLPEGRMEPVGYVVLQHAMRLDRPVQAYGRWMDQIPGAFDHEIMRRAGIRTSPDESLALATLKNYRSLMPLAMEARKPMFALRPADGALGAQQQAVSRCYEDFRSLALNIAEHLEIKVPLVQGLAR